MQKKGSGSGPIFLGLDIQNQKQFQDDLSTIFSKKIESLIAFGKEKYIDLLNNYKKTMKNVPNLHITTLFIGKDSSKLQTKYYKSFTKGAIINIKVTALVYVPDRILTAVIQFPEGKGEIQIENKYPHITLSTGKYLAKMSNDVLEALFEKQQVVTCENQGVKVFEKVEINGENVQVICMDVADLIIQEQTIAKCY